MSRTERLKRINEALATGERNARTELASANRELAAADAGLRSVVEQCRHTGIGIGGGSGPGSDLSVQAGLAVVQSGLAEAAAREADRRVASDEVAEKSETWRAANNRYEAASRLLERWRVESDAELKGRAIAELDEAIAARSASAVNRPGNSRPHRGRRSDDVNPDSISREAEDGLQ